MDRARWRKPRGLGVLAIDALRCDSNQSDEGAGVAGDEHSMALENNVSQSDGNLQLLFDTHPDQPLIGINNSIPYEGINITTVAASWDAL